jgi:putative phosphoesterase
VKVLVLSDTHLSSPARLPAQVVELALAADAVLHAGDVTDVSVLQELSTLAPVHAVLGNNDLWMDLPESLEVSLDGVRVAMIHDSGARVGREARLRRLFPSADVVVFGHSHDPVVSCQDGQWLVNPGSPTQRRRQPVHTVAWLELGAGAVVSAEIVEVDR